MRIVRIPNFQTNFGVSDFKTKIADVIKTKYHTLQDHDNKKVNN